MPLVTEISVTINIFFIIKYILKIICDIAFETNSLLFDAILFYCSLQMKQKLVEQVIIIIANLLLFFPVKKQFFKRKIAQKRENIKLVEKQK